MESLNSAIDISTRHPNEQQQISGSDTRCPICFRTFGLPANMHQHFSAKHGGSPNIVLELQGPTSADSSEVIAASEYIRLRSELAVTRKEKKRLELRLRRTEDERDELKEMNRKLRRKLEAATVMSQIDAANEAEQEQIILVGSKKIYERVDEKLREGKIDPYFSNEQLKLYRWRYSFFYDNYGDPYRDGHWYTDGHDDSHGFDTVPYQITCHFDEVVKKLTLVTDEDLRVYFENDELASQVSFIFDSSDEHDLPWSIGQLRDGSDLDLRELGVTFGQAAHMIVEKFSNCPKSLQQQAMKSVLAHNLVLTELPKSLQVKALNGMFTEHSVIPKNLSEEGRFRYEVLLTEFEIDYNDFRYDLHDRELPKYDKLFPKES